MAESLQVFAAEPMALFEDADQFIADEYFNKRQTISTDSEHSSSDENEEDISATQATFMDPRKLIVVLSLSLFSIVLSLLPFSILSLLPFLISPSLSSIPSCSSDQFSVFLR